MRRDITELQNDTVLPHSGSFQYASTRTADPQPPHDKWNRNDRFLQLARNPGLTQPGLAVSGKGIVVNCSGSPFSCAFRAASVPRSPENGAKSLWPRPGWSGSQVSGNSVNAKKLQIVPRGRSSRIGKCNQRGSVVRVGAAKAVAAGLPLSLSSAYNRRREENR